MKILLPRNFQESQQFAHRNSSFGWVELNIILFFLNSENFEFSGRKGLYFRTEGVCQYPNIVQTWKLRGSHGNHVISKQICFLLSQFEVSNWNPTGIARNSQVMKFPEIHGTVHGMHKWAVAEDNQNTPRLAIFLNL